MNNKILGAAALGLALNAPGCIQEQCEVVPLDGGEKIESFGAVQDLCNQNYQGILTCFKVPVNPKIDPVEKATYCDDPNRSTILNDIFFDGVGTMPAQQNVPYYVDVDEDGATRLCVTGDAELDCE